MIYNINDLIAKRDRLAYELENLNQYPETIQKRQAMLDIQQRLNDMDNEIRRQDSLARQRHEAYMYMQRTGRNEWTNPSCAGMIYNINPSPYSPASSPYGTSFEQQPRPIISTNNSAAHRYARKELPEQFKNAKVINNEPPSSYIVKAEPPKPVKKYTKDSKYPILCESSLKEIELKLETGYIQREVEYSNAVKNNNNISLFKTDKEISSSEEFFNTFKKNLSIDAIFGYYSSTVYILPVTNLIKDSLSVFNTLKDELNDQNFFNNLDHLFKVFDRLKPYFNIRYTNIFNDLVEYSYCLNLKCDSLIEDSFDLKQELNKIKLVVDKTKYKQILSKIISDILSLDVKLIEDNKYLKIKIKEPEVLVNCCETYKALSKQDDVMCLRSNSYEALYNRLKELFAFYGEKAHSIKLVAVNETMNKIKFKVYTCSIGPEVQFIIARIK